MAADFDTFPSSLNPELKEFLQVSRFFVAFSSQLVFFICFPVLIKVLFHWANTRGISPQKSLELFGQKCGNFFYFPEWILYYKIEIFKKFNKWKFWSEQRYIIHYPPCVVPVLLSLRPVNLTERLCILKSIFWGLVHWIHSPEDTWIWGFRERIPRCW